MAVVDTGCRAISERARQYTQAGSFCEAGLMASIAASIMDQFGLPGARSAALTFQASISSGKPWPLPASAK